MKYFLISITFTIIMAVIGCDSDNGAGVSNTESGQESHQDMVPVSFDDLTGDPSTQELKKAEKCLSKFATKLEMDLVEGMASAGYKVDIFSVAAHKIFTDSQNSVNVQYSISGMTILPSGKEQFMDNEKKMINCSSQNI